MIKARRRARPAKSGKSARRNVEGAKAFVHVSYVDGMVNERLAPQCDA